MDTLKKIYENPYHIHIFYLLHKYGMVKGTSFKLL